MERKYELTNQEIQDIVDTFVKHNIDYTKFLQFDETKSVIFDLEGANRFVNFIFQNYSKKDFENFPDDLHKAFNRVKTIVFNQIIRKHRSKFNSTTLDHLLNVCQSTWYDEPIDNTSLKSFYGDNFEELFLDAEKNIELFKKPFEMYRKDKQNKELIKVCLKTFNKVSINEKVLIHMHALYVKDILEMNGF